MATVPPCHFCGSERARRQTKYSVTICANEEQCYRRMRRVEGRCESCNGAHSDCGEA